MKKFLIATALLASASLANADQKLVSADGSSLTALCLAAAAAPADLLDIASTHGIAAREIDTVRCNGITLKRFVLKYGNDETASVAETTTNHSVAGYLLRKTDNSPLTELCAAAAVSDQEYAKVKQQHFSSEKDIDAEVQCNGLSLKSFVRKFRDADVRLISVR